MLQLISEFIALILLLHVLFIFYVDQFSCGILLGFLIGLSIHALFTSSETSVHRLASC
jgi:hypothetical protein